ncbi:hypothetical protein RchiOBHm_Chr1g0316301 [Rosa chinensis]|uniref:Uncharacterized protein n=1 Tax=Rosa chinensis TaxID=74649 RepID=A0A2P6S7N7_ROSCH|nr:hypothetical protein RchiOBHm_Chr1g0316301 [Rosa chinensis]
MVMQIGDVARDDAGRGSSSVDRVYGERRTGADGTLPDCDVRRGTGRRWWTGPESSCWAWSAPLGDYPIGLSCWAEILFQSINFYLG